MRSTLRGGSRLLEPFHVSSRLSNWRTGVPHTVNALHRREMGPDEIALQSLENAGTTILKVICNHFTLPLEPLGANLAQTRGWSTLSWYKIAFVWF